MGLSSIADDVQGRSLRKGSTRNTRDPLGTMYPGGVHLKVGDWEACRVSYSNTFLPSLLCDLSKNFIDPTL